MELIHWTEGWNLWDLVGCLKDNAKLGSGTIFRGQGDSDWKLVPSLFRRDVAVFGDMSIADRYSIAENGMIERFFDRAFLLLPRFDRGWLVDRAVSQHYGIPTQLLDWTLDPFVALYFAVKDHRSSFDAAFYYINPLTIMNARSCVAFPYQGRIAKCHPPIIDERMRLQKSVFTVQSYGKTRKFEPLDDRTLKISADNEGTHKDDEVMSFGKIVIPAKTKPQIFFELLNLGIDSSILFPGLQGIGERIADVADITNYGGMPIF